MPKKGSKKAMSKKKIDLPIPGKLEEHNENQKTENEDVAPHVENGKDGMETQKETPMETKEDLNSKDNLEEGSLKTSEKRNKRARKDSESDENMEKGDNSESDKMSTNKDPVAKNKPPAKRGRKVKENFDEKLEEAKSEVESLKRDVDSFAEEDSTSKPKLEESTSKSKLDEPVSMPKPSNSTDDETNDNKPEDKAGSSARRGRKKTVESTTNVVIRERTTRIAKQPVVVLKKSAVSRKRKNTSPAAASSQPTVDKYFAASSDTYQPKVVITRNKELEDKAEKKSKENTSDNKKEDTKNVESSKQDESKENGETSSNGELNGEAVEELSKNSKSKKAKSGKSAKNSKSKTAKNEKAKTKENVSQKASSEEEIKDDHKEEFHSDATTSNGKKWNFKIASWNVNGIRAWLEKDGLSYLQNEQPDILCVQETKCSDDKLPSEAHVKGYHCHFLAGDKDGYSGVGLMSKIKPISLKDGIGIDQHDTEGRVITAEYDKFYLVAAYVPNAGRGLVRLEYRMQWDKDFMQYLKKLDKKKPVILTGDLNVAHNEIDLANPKTNKKSAGFTKEEREGFSALLSEDFVDSFRYLYPEKTGAYTFWTYMNKARAKNVGWRLDYFVLSNRFVEPHLCDNVIRSSVLGSDHCPIVLFLNI